LLVIALRRALLVAVAVNNKKAVIDVQKCNLCGACVPACKFKAIVLESRLLLLKMILAAIKGVWVFAEQKKAKFNRYHSS